MVALWGCALVALTWASPAQAAWNNVFQVTCWGCKQKPAIANYPPAPVAAPQQDCPQPCPQQQCTTRYIQRSYYQPVTTYRTTYYMEPVTTYKTSFYYEPVTSYRYSCYCDPCTGCCKQIATPCTSYRLREQCCPVTSYLQRSCLQPVTTYQQMCYYVPETTCCTTTIGAPIMGTPPGAGSGSMGGSFGGPSGGSSTGEPPVIGEGREPMNPNVNPNDRITPIPRPGVGDSRERMDGGGGARFERPNPGFGTPYPAQPTQSPPPPARIRLDKTASLDDVNVRGQLVSTGQQPQRNTRVLFVSQDQERLQMTATTDTSGKFDIQLASGNWLVYTPGADGRPVFNQKVYVEGTGPRSVLLVSNPGR
jgi:hypothetical protein